MRQWSGRPNGPCNHTPTAILLLLHLNYRSVKPDTARAPHGRGPEWGAPSCSERFGPPENKQRSLMKRPRRFGSAGKNTFSFSFMDAASLNAHVLPGKPRLLRCCWAAGLPGRPASRAAIIMVSWHLRPARVKVEARAHAREQYPLGPGYKAIHVERVLLSRVRVMHECDQCVDGDPREGQHRARAERQQLRHTCIGTVQGARVC